MIILWQSKGPTSFVLKSMDRMQLVKLICTEYIASPMYKNTISRHLMDYFHGITIKNYRLVKDHMRPVKCSQWR